MILCGRDEDVVLGKIKRCFGIRIYKLRTFAYTPYRYMHNVNLFRLIIKQNVIIYCNRFIYL